MTMELKMTSTAFIFHDGRLLLTRHRKTGRWLHVGGHVEDGETPYDALEREIREEVNLKVRYLETYGYFDKDIPKQGFEELPRPFYIHTRDMGDHRRLSFDFVCVADDITGLKLQESELDSYQWFTRKEIEDSPEMWEPLRTLVLKAFDVYKGYTQKNV